MEPRNIYTLEPLSRPVGDYFQRSAYGPPHLPHPHTGDFFFGLPEKEFKGMKILHTKQMPYGRRKYKKRSQRFRRFRAKRRQQKLSVRTVEKISRKSAKAVLSEETETFKLHQHLIVGQTYPNTLTGFANSGLLLHRRGLTDNNANLIQHWGPQIALQNTGAGGGPNAMGDGYRVGDKVFLKGIQVRGYIYVDPANLPNTATVQFYLLSHAPVRPASGNKVDPLYVIRDEKTNFTVEQKDNQTGKLYRTEFKKQWKLGLMDTFHRPKLIPVNFFISIKKQQRWSPTLVVGAAQQQQDLLTRPLFLKWRCLGVQEGAAPLVPGNYPQVNVTYRWYYTDI